MVFRTMAIGVLIEGLIAALVLGIISPNGFPFILLAAVCAIALVELLEGGDS